MIPADMHTQHQELDQHAQTNQCYNYLTEPVSAALIPVMLIPVIVAAFMPLLILQLLVLSMAVGPALWALFQWLRGRHHLFLQADQLVIEHPITGLRRRIPYRMVKGITFTPQNRLLIAYIVERPVNAPYDAGSSSGSLLQTHPAENRPQNKLAVITNVEALPALANELSERLDPSKFTFEPKFLVGWFRRVRARNVIFAILFILGTPVYFIFLYRLITSFML